jgi:hypothetical protein
MLGGDVWFSPVRMVDVSGHTYYNITRHAIAEHSYLLTVKPLKVLTMTGIYNRERFSDYFTFSNLPSLFNARTGDKLESYGGSASWVVVKPLEVIGDYRHYKRDSLGKSDRYGVEARLGLLDNRVRSGVAFHRSRGGDAINAYSEVRAYGTYRGTKYHGSLDGIVHFYDHAIDGKSNAFELIASAGYRIIPDLLVSGDISYGENPRLSSELRGLVKLTYNFNYASKGAKP